jgi:processive 1,2-diacylglycerol beta-glucosyltransferase
MTAVKKDLGFKLVSVITDLRVHSLWVAGCIDHYFTALKITKSDLINLGVSQEKVTCGFVPVRAGFLRRDSRESLAKKFKLDSRPSIIFVSFPRGRFPYLRKSIQVLEDSFNIFIIYGSNRGLKRRLEKLGSARIRFFPFYDEIWELFRLSSVIISKPGGMTVFEGLCMKKSFVFTHYIPGQEAANMELLVKGGVARFARIGKELVDAVNYYNEKADSRKDNYPFEVNDVIEPLSALIERWSNG